MENTTTIQAQQAAPDNGLDFWLVDVVKRDSFFPLSCAIHLLPHGDLPVELPSLKLVSQLQLLNYRDKNNSNN